jgi:MFS family permease
VSLHELIPVLQTSIGPVILISGVGLLLLSMSNRFTHLLDRGRQLAADVRSGHLDARRQLDILGRRARLVRLSIALATLSLLLAASLIIVIFVTAWMRLESAYVLAGLFIACLLALIGSILAFLEDVNLSLSAFDLEVHSLEPADPNA